MIDAAPGEVADEAGCDRLEMQECNSLAGVSWNDHAFVDVPPLGCGKCHCQDLRSYAHNDGHGDDRFWPEGLDWQDDGSLYSCFFLTLTVQTSHKYIFYDVGTQL